MADFFLKIMCCYCQQEIQDLRIKCVDCKDFYICPECFKCGAEIGSHRNYHRYQFENPDTAPLCGGSDGWTAREEFLLLDAIEQYGYGNWEDISDHVETRNAEDALNEYVTRCIEGSIGRLTWSTAANNKPDLNKQIKPDVGPLSPGITSKLPQLNVSPEDAKILGYMPQRDDFEREHDNSAEDLVSPLFISSLEDDELDIAMKLSQVDMYTKRLRERASRRRISRDYQLVSQFFAAARNKDNRLSKKRISKEEREFHDRMRGFARFHTSHEHEKFLQNLQREREMKLRISELSKYRNGGITNHEECMYFEQELSHHDEDSREKIFGSSGLCPSPPPLLPKKREKSDDTPSSSEGKYTSRTGGKGQTDEDKRETGGTSASTPSASCYHLLSRNEVKLCSSLNMKPTRYMNKKAYLFQECYSKYSKKKDVANTSGTDSPILNYMMTSGWITAI